MDAATLSAGVLRTRRYRARRRNGVRCLRVRVSESAIQALIEEGFLRRDETSDHAAVVRSF
jgi:hypothetical protein